VASKEMKASAASGKLLKGFCDPDRPRRENGASMYPLIILVGDSDGLTIPELVAMTGWTRNRVEGRIYNGSCRCNRTGEVCEHNSYFEAFQWSHLPLGRRALKYRLTDYWGHGAFNTLIKDYCVEFVDGMMELMTWTKWEAQYGER